MSNETKLTVRQEHIEESILKELRDLEISELKIQQKKLELIKKSVIFANQDKAAEDIFYRFSNRKKIMILALGMTQSGKTGVMCACVKKFTNIATNPVPVSNIFIITGLSSREWTKQTKERMPQILHERIIHRDNLHELEKKIGNRKNVLIIMDEVQIACGIKQTVSKELHKAGLLDIQNLLEKDIKIIEFSATPNGTLYDSDKWENHSDKVRVSPGESYVSCIDLKARGRVKQCKRLSGKDFEPSILDELNEALLSFKSYRYHLIRTRTGGSQEEDIVNIKKYFGEEDYDYKNYDMDSLSEESEIFNEEKQEYEYKTEIDILLETKPLKHTFIFLMEKARCAKTFRKENIGIWYERFAKNFADDVVTQGLLGRATGYDDNGDSIIFSNLESVDKFEKLWISNFEDKSVKWKSNSTSHKSGETRSKGTFNSRVSSDSKKEKKETPKPSIVKRKTKAELVTYFKDNDLNKKDALEIDKKCNGPRDKGDNEMKDMNGFFVCITQYDKSKKIRNRAEFLEKEDTEDWRFYGKNNTYRVYPCYSDITDKSTLEWWLIYYKI